MLRLMCGIPGQSEPKMTLPAAQVTPMTNHPSPAFIFVGEEGGNLFGTKPGYGVLAEVKPILPSSSDSHIKFREGKRDNPLNPFALLGNLLETLIDRCIKILLAASVAHPSRHIFDINRLPLKAKPGQNAPLLHFSLAELALITFHRVHLSTTLPRHRL